MAKIFQTNINLNGNQLLNAVLHNASSAPTIYKAGQIYFDSTALSGRGSLKVSVQTNPGTSPATYAWRSINTTDLSVNTINTYTGDVTVSGTSNEVVVTNSSNTITLSLPSSVILPGSLQVTTNTTLNGTLSVTGGKTTLTAGTTAGASLNIPIGVNPTSPVVGDIWLKADGLYAYYASGTHTIADLDSSQTFTNKTLNFNVGSGNVASNIPNSALVNSSIKVTPGTGISANGGTAQVTVNLGDTLTINNTGVTSVGLVLPNIFTVTTGTVTTTGSLTADLATQVKNSVLAGPTTGSDAKPTFRSLVDADIPNTVARLAGPTFTGTVTIPTLTLTNALSIANGGTGATTAAGARTNLGAAESGANSSITSLSGLTTALTVGQGGTGTSTGPTNGQILIGKTDGTYAVANITQDTNTGVTITNGNGTIKLGTVQDIRTTATPTFAQITLAADPTQALQAATKQYVDNNTAGLNAHEAVSVATTVTLAANYVAGTTSADGGTGIGATLEASANGALVIDNVTVNNGDRVLVKNQTDAKQNGIYVVTSKGAAGSKWLLTRAIDFDNHVIGQITSGDFVFVYAETGFSVTPTQQNTGWVQNNIGAGTNRTVVIGTETIDFVQFSGAGTVTAGDGISVVGSQIYVNLGSTADNSSTNAKNPSGLSVNNGTLQLRINSAGAVSTDSSGLKVNVGTGLTISGNAITFASDTVTQTASGVSGGTRVYGIQKLTATITGNAVASNFDIIHNLGTRDVDVRVYQASSTPDTQWAIVETDLTHKDGNTVTVGFANAPASGVTYNVVVIG
jgi:hypothetical protein